MMEPSMWLHAVERGARFELVIPDDAPVAHTRITAADMARYLRAKNDDLRAAVAGAGREPTDAPLDPEVWRAAYEAFTAGDDLGLGVMDKRRLRLAIVAALSRAAVPKSELGEVMGAVREAVAPFGALRPLDSVTEQAERTVPTEPGERERLTDWCDRCMASYEVNDCPRCVARRAVAGGPKRETP